VAEAGRLIEHAPAKVNLTLRVVGRRPDGYHELESLVAFADVADTLTLEPDAPLTLAVTGPTATAAGPAEENLVLKAARALAGRVPGLRLGGFLLTKNLPVAAGLGGGSADAAAALRLLSRANALPPDDARLLDAAKAAGADAPVCLAGRARVMRGIGEILSEPLDLPRLDAVLVHPGVALATKDVFAAFAASGSVSAQPTASLLSVRQDIGEAGEGALQEFLAQRGNDLEVPAISLCPVVADVLTALRALDGVRLVRMSGSGATCFAVFATGDAAGRGASVLRERHPTWWVRAVTLA
jgi:4-diphosphocytidyl-2-C-methyl-D-erythritol kinase